MSVTKISAREASELIGFTYLTIRNAVERGDLTCFPRQGGRLFLAREQVELFKGKPHVKQSWLTPDEYKLWLRYQSEILTGTSKPESSVDLDALTENVLMRLITMFAPTPPQEERSREGVPFPSISGGDAIRIMLLGLIGGLGTYSITKDVDASILAGATVSIVAFLILYRNGEVGRAQVEQKLNQLPEQEREYWLPVLDHPELLAEKARELVASI